MKWKTILESALTLSGSKFKEERASKTSTSSNNMDKYP